MKESQVRYSKIPFRNLSASDEGVWTSWVEGQPELRRAFFSPAYVRAVAKSGIEVNLLIARRSNCLVALLPVQRIRGFWGLLSAWEPAGGGLADYFGLVQAPGERLSALPMLEACGIGALYFSHLDSLDGWKFGRSNENGLRVGFRIRFDSGPDEYWARLSERDRKVTSDLCRRERKLVNDHGEPTFTYRSQRVDSDLEELLELKQRQYRRTGKSSPLNHPSYRLQLVKLAGVDLPTCAGRLSVLRVGERMVAAHFGLKCMNILHYWFPVYDEEFRAYSPGHLLLRNIISAASSEGINLIDRGEGDTPAKRIFGNEEHHFLSDVIQHPSWRGYIGKLGLSAYWRVKSWEERHSLSS